MSRKCETCEKAKSDRATNGRCKGGYQTMVYHCADPLCMQAAQNIARSCSGHFYYNQDGHA